MPEIDDFSRKLLADFIAARLRALQIEKKEPGRVTEDQDPVSRSINGHGEAAPTSRTRPGFDTAKAASKSEPV